MPLILAARHYLHSAKRAFCHRNCQEEQVSFTGGGCPDLDPRP